MSKKKSEFGTDFDKLIAEGRIAFISMSDMTIEAMFSGQNAERLKQLEDEFAKLEANGAITSYTGSDGKKVYCFGEPKNKI